MHQRAAGRIDPEEKPMISSTHRIRALIAGTAPAAVLAAVLAATLALPPGFAAASPQLVGANVGTTADAISASLAAQGYEVRKIKPEDGMLEAYALKDGKRYEIYVDTTTGTVAKVKAED
jgi:hypothetical protein